MSSDSESTVARPEVILELANEFTTIVLGFRDSEEATVFEAILGLRLASENVLHALQAAGAFNDEQIEVIRTALQKVSVGKPLDPRCHQNGFAPKDDYGF